MKIFMFLICLFSFHKNSLSQDITQDSIEAAISEKGRSETIKVIEIKGDYYKNSSSNKLEYLTNTFFIDTLTNELLSVIVMNDSTQKATTHHFLNNKLVKTVALVIKSDGFQELEDLYYYSEDDNKAASSSNNKGNRKFIILSEANQFLNVLENYKTLNAKTVNSSDY